MQKLTLIGRLGADPDMRFTPGGKAVTNFPVAVNEYNDKTLWVRVTVWEDKAENCKEFLKKGSQVYVEGRLDFDADTGGPETYLSKKDGKTRASFNMTAYTVQFLDKKEDGVRRSEAVEQSGGGVPWKQ